jgi:hypothetical protein
LTTFPTKGVVGASVRELSRHGYGLIASLLDSHGRGSGWGNFDHVSELLGVPIDARLVVVLVAVTIAGLLALR